MSTAVLPPPVVIAGINPHASGNFRETPKLTDAVGVADAEKRAASEAQ